MKKFVITAVLLQIFFGYSVTSGGKTGWLIFRKVHSPRPKPLTIVAAIRGDISGILYNPSVLATIQQKEVFTIADFGLAGDNLLGLIYGHPLSKSGITAGLLNYNIGKEKIYWIETGNEKSDEVTLQNDYLGFISYGRYLSDNIALGLTTKFAKTQLVEAVDSFAYCIDIGGSYFYNKLVFSLALQNLGKSEKFLDKEEKLPTSVYLAFGYGDELLSLGRVGYMVGIDMSYIVEEGRFTSGLAVEVIRSPVSLFLGYRLGVDEGFFNVGIALSIKNFEIGYAFIPSLFLNPSHRIFLGFKF
ncbi:MAG: hypothetical protein RMJ67_08830 [Elusimicrobiota bacterium]|nr:hypothetical protein [Endomicrobiia bacterium]MDW8166600.1 hypothetical protein [Elusimicrobiota bacterium]